MPNTINPQIYDTRLLKHIRRILRVDTIAVTRPSATTDSEGSPTGGRTAVFSGMGLTNTATDQEQLAAESRGTKIDQVLCLELGLDLREGDWVQVNGATTYEVVEAADNRLYRRATMRVVL